MGLPLEERRPRSPRCFLRGRGIEASIALLKATSPQREEALEEALREEGFRVGFPTSQIVTIPIGTECPDLAPREERRGRLVRQAELESLGPLLLHVGSFTPEKNHR